MWLAFTKMTGSKSYDTLLGMEDEARLIDLLEKCSTLFDVAEVFVQPEDFIKFKKIMPVFRTHPKAFCCTSDWFEAYSLLWVECFPCLYFLQTVAFSTVELSDDFETAHCLSSSVNRNFHIFLHT